MNPADMRDIDPGALTPKTPQGPVAVTVTDTCWSAILRHAAAAADGRETGGVLLGHHHLRPQPTLDVVHAGDAGPDAVRQPVAFRRDVAHAQALADRAYYTDGSIWLGDWHTHPAGPARPSRRDLASYRLLFSDAELAFEVFLAVIVVPGQPQDWHRPRITGWIVSPDDNQPVPLLRRTYRERTSQ